MNILREAAKNLPGRWYKGGLEDGKGNHCAVGHMYVAAGADEHYDIASEEDERAMSRQFAFANTVVEEFTNGKYDSLPFFNDDENTTEADVVALLEKAAIKWDEKEGLS